MYKIGILNFTKVLSTGGGFHYIMSLLEGLKKDKKFHLHVFYDDINFENKFNGTNSFERIYIGEHENIFPKIIRGGSTYFGIKSPLLGRYEKIKKMEMDLLISFGSNIGFQLEVPTISFIGDVMYRYYPNLPEYSRNGNLIRDISTRKLLKYSDYVVVDSNENAEDLISFFNVKADKLIPIPMCAPPHIYQYKNLPEKEVDEICDKYKLPENFIFYPAQFWSHKNHKRLVKAIHLLKIKYNTTVDAVFAGAEWQNYGNVVELINELGMNDQIKCLGYIPEKDLVALYKKAVALVFASFAEYTNLPVLEAMVLGTPVLCSNKFSMPQQLGCAGLLFDPFDVDDIAEKILEVWNDKEIRVELREKGFERTKELSVENFIGNWTKVILKTIEKN
ncbi:MAG: glycosyltransferase family 4 protein [Ignavibacteriales bacterium]|nr:glycosyltransferase family 4 protein [Ignavibacteriales bacterium]